LSENRIEPDNYCDITDIEMIFLLQQTIATDGDAS